jgi:cell division protein FtsL
MSAPAASEVFAAIGIAACVLVAVVIIASVIRFVLSTGDDITDLRWWRDHQEKQIRKLQDDIYELRRPK